MMLPERVDKTLIRFKIGRGRKIVLKNGLRLSAGIINSITEILEYIRDTEPDKLREIRMLAGKAKLTSEEQDRLMDRAFGEDAMNLLIGSTDLTLTKESIGSLISCFFDGDGKIINPSKQGA